MVFLFQRLVRICGRGKKDGLLMQFVTLRPQQLWSIELGGHPASPVAKTMDCVGVFTDETVPTAMAAAAVGTDGITEPISFIPLRSQDAPRLLRLHGHVQQPRRCCVRSKK
jgi:hypothetical protein